jgi:hypothetical protein
VALVTSAPLESFTVPLIEPVISCAKAAHPASVARITNALQMMLRPDIVAPQVSQLTST